MPHLGVTYLERYYLEPSKETLMVHDTIHKEVTRRVVESPLCKNINRFIIPLPHGTN